MALEQGGEGYLRVGRRQCLERVEGGMRLAERHAGALAGDYES